MGNTTSIGVESVTPERAQEYLQYNYAHNRKLRPGWASFLANEMREGRFVSTAEIHIAYYNGQPMLVNGQHTCSAIVLYGKPVAVTVRKTSTSEPGQIALLYAFGHDNGIKRTFVDGLGAYNVGEEFDIGPTRLSELSSALRHIRAGFGDDHRANRSMITPPSVTEIVERIPEWAPHLHAFWNQIEAGTSGGKTKKLCSKRGSFAVVLTTLRFQPKLAREFWQGVVELDGMLTTDPRFIARRVLENSKDTAGASAKSPPILSRELARCWRGFLNGERMAQAPKLIKEADPIVLLGTPFDGKQPPPAWWPG